MASILFLMDNKEGHIIPSFKLAHSLQERGHQVTYLSILDNEKLVIDQGFCFRPIFTDIYERGFNQQNKQTGDQDALNSQKRKEHLYRILQGTLDPILEAKTADILIASSFLCLEILLIYYKYRVKPVVLTTFLRDPATSFKKECLDTFLDLPGDTGIEIISHIQEQGVNCQSLVSLLDPVDELCEMVLCPSELEMNNIVPGKNVVHIGPSIFDGRSIGEKLHLDKITRRKKLIYASLGSHAVIYGEAAERFFEALISVMKSPAMKDMHLVLSTGEETNFSRYGKIPANITLSKWVSQIEILQVASLVITHGGLGTIKECIYYGVPMIVFPMKLDQTRNALLVDYHLLGMSARIEEISAEALLANMDYVINDTVISQKVSAMQAIFREKEAAAEGVQIIERLLAQQINTMNEAINLSL